MIRGRKVGLRARQESDLSVLHEELYNDVATFARADGRPWRPASLPEHSGHKLLEPSDDLALFSVVELATGELAGEGLLWNIDLFQRSAHLGLSLRPAYRGRGLGSDLVRVLCTYGFVIRGLRRLQVDTLADNDAMLAAAEKAGFHREGTLRRAAWVCGREIDQAVLGMLHDEWKPEEGEVP